MGIVGAMSVSGSVPVRQEDSARFREAVERLSGRQADAQFGIAVSGGPDSMALLWLALNAFPGRVMAATVDHGLRPEAADEAAMVAAFCARHGVPHATLRPARPITGNIQSQARTARYALLDQWRMDNGVGWLMTAHHAGDQIETMLMRLNRGAGVGGLAGVRARNHIGPRCRTLAEYRARHAQYRADPQLQAAHAHTPWIIIWDDHDIENDCAELYPLRPGEVVGSATIARTVSKPEVRCRTVGRTPTEATRRSRYCRLCGRSSRT